MKIIDIIVMVLLNILLISLLSSNKLLFKEPLINIPSLFIDIIQFTILPLLILDIFLKYKKVKDVRLFLKKHYLDLIMLVLFPIFVMFKFIKLTLKLYKIVSISKISKTFLKILFGIKNCLNNCLITFKLYLFKFKTLFFCYFNNICQFW
jgi:hypothetical protein